METRSDFRVAAVRITRKLAIVVAVPLVAVLGFAALAVGASTAEASRAELLRRLVTVGSAVGELAQTLRHERALAVLTLVHEPDVEAFVEQTRRTDHALAAYRDRRDALRRPPAAAAELLDRIDSRLRGLAPLRELVTGGGGGASTVAFRYRIVIADLMAFREAVAAAGAAPAEIADRWRASTAVSQIAEYTGRQQVAVLRSVGFGSLTPTTVQELTAARAGRVEAELVFDATATPAWRALREQVAVGPDAVAAQLLEDRIARLPAGQRLRLDPREWTEVHAGRLARWGELESAVDADLIAEVTALRDGARRLAVWQSVGVVLTVALAVLLALWLGRPVVGGLRRLRDAAHHVAHEALPAVVAQLDDHQALGGLDPDEFADRIPPPLRVVGRDELAEVAEAFNRVHRAAVRTAAAQAALRLNIGAMFVNLARRGQALAGRLTAALDDAERDEQDPQRLARLFTVDHLVTLLGRINDSLLVLGGAASAQVRTDDEPLTAIITAAQGQVEAYARVEAGLVDDGVVVPAAAVDDVVKLLAELIDNGCRYSPPDTPVRVDARWVGDRVVFLVTDLGIGIDDARREALNRRLAARPPLDLAAVRAMGLTVVGHLAARHGIQVHLRPGAGCGTIAEVTLPPGLFRLTGSPPGRRPVVGRPGDHAPTDGRRLGGGHVPAPLAAGPPTTPVRSPAAERADLTAEVRLPIFEQVRSRWFHPSGPDSAWPTAADEGWRLAADAAAPRPAGTTANGLPRRQPGAQLVPGAPPVSPPESGAFTDWRDPARVSASLAAYSRGLATGRARYQEQTSGE